MSSRHCLMLAGLSGFLAVLLGAFGAHGLGGADGYLQEKYASAEAKNVAGMQQPASWKYYQDFQTGVRYHMWHTLALLGVGVWMRQQSSRALSVAAWSWTIGILLFSGALYVLVIAGPRAGGVPWGMVAPLGGTALMIGWLAALVAAFHSTPRTAD